MVLEARAVGVQIYECTQTSEDPARYEWTFKAPDAELFDSAGRKIGKHYAGPTWESNDGSKVVGEVKARYDGPDSNGIPWLLLSAKTTSGAGGEAGYRAFGLHGVNHFTSNSSANRQHWRQ